MHIFRHIFLSNYWWQRSDIWSQASYRYPISWEAFLDPSDSYFLFADLVGFYTHWAYMHIFRHIFLSNYWWQKSDIWSQASYRYPISWEAFLNPSDSYFLFADFVDFYTHWTYMLIFRRIFLSNYWWQKSDIWSQASYGYPISWEAILDPSDSYFLFADFVDFYTHFNIHLYMHNFRRIFLSNYWWQESDIWSQASYRYAILWEALLDPSDSYFLFADLVGFYTHWTYMHIFRHIFLSNYWWQRSDIWSQASYRYLQINNFKIRQSICKIRVSASAHPLNIETGRYKNIIRSERKCTNCSEGDIEDEKHFVVDCPLYENIRVKFFDKVIDLCPNFRYMDTSSKFVWLFTNENMNKFWKN